MMTRRQLLTFLTTSAVARHATAAESFRLSPQTTQLILGLADSWDTSHVTLQRYERKRGSAWKTVGEAWKARLGASGLAWGRGLHSNPSGVKLKTEGDKRAPAGAFGLGLACGYERDIARHPAQEYFQVTSRDLWVEDAASPHYNQRLRLDHEPRTPWEKKQQMKQPGDAAHALKLLILHNTPPRAVPGGGSAIFFHIWRGGGSKPSSGCTTMAEAALRRLIAWVDPHQLPVYVLLPRAEYEKRRSAWGLP